MANSNRAEPALFSEILVSEQVYKRYRAYRSGDSNKP
jgi:hypothetical protein